MDCRKVGGLIYTVRKEKKMTQSELAHLLNISDKTISKWERGLGCPDVSLLGELSNVLGVNIEQILLGNLDPNEQDKGNMVNVKFYVCQTCDNVMTSTGAAGLSCCGRTLEPLLPKPDNADHHITVLELEDDYFVTMAHEMSKDHYISFAAYCSYDRMMIIKLYPEQPAEVRFPKLSAGKLYAYCNQHGLWEYEQKELGSTFTPSEFVFSSYNTPHK
ncbi:helix-turn-helix domain-containing protein [Paenibacillus assamensis]|uniref:helix-turn-helix domain-containing protein n=1 Tax=Paenibacillus assamensis TaxID=311244 RepID=UPI0004231F22|nr:helix-turn-helix domain-containing protein [Paenibacillus assamensis]